MLRRLASRVCPVLLCAVVFSCEDDGGSGDAGAHDGGRPHICALPAEPGPCDALFHRYHFDEDSETCLHFVYGGCEGNLNNFSSLDECRTVCREPSGQGAACEVEGVVYPNGSKNVPDPQSCNTCTCVNGELAYCTEIACPRSCPDGTAFATSCMRCGPTDACEVVRTGCHASCREDSDCAADSCHDGVCRTLCG